MSAAARWRRRAALLLRLLPHVPLAAALLLAGRLARRVRAAGPPAQAAGWSPGLSVIVPERGTPDLLAETLEALAAALRGVAEPTQVIVVVNGAAADDYAELRRRHAGVDWQFHALALGYNGAIAAGLAQVRYDWCYLLNSDMRLAPDALVRVLAERRPWVFAITSQIFFADPARRREETGWSDFHANPDRPEVYERLPAPAARLTRGNLYPGGGSSLCRTAPLRRYVRGSVDYAPFYWEDADWGARAWADGWEVLFCPLSHAWHHHRGTVARYYGPAEVERVIARNALLFDLRHAWSGCRAATLLRAIALADARTRRELRRRGLAWRVLQARMATLRARHRGLRLDLVTLDRWYDPDRAPQPDGRGRRPRVLLVSPFALFPPAHGGARRVAELVQRLRGEVDFILLGDEASLYGEAAEPWLDGLPAVRLVEGRGDRPGEAAQPLAVRLQRHAWPGLRAALAHLIERYDPDIVQVEFMELAQLAAGRSGRARWLLALHDVYLSGRGQDAPDDAIQGAALAHFDARTVCSAEDASLLPAHLPARLVGNGATDRRGDYQPSPDSPRLLFMGPFRYAPNLNGLLEFLDSAWPVLRRRFPALQLTVLGGEESAAVVAREPRLRQPGVEVLSRFVDPAPHLAACSLSINPQRDIRGSSIKLIESLLAGRVCVSSAEGARGFAADALEGLVVATDIAAMAAPIAALLDDTAERHRRERADGTRLDAYTWDAAAQRLLALYRELIAASG